MLDDKWVNGTVLHYCFFDRPPAWTTTDAEKDVVRQAFKIWKDVGIGLDFQEVSALDEAEIRIGFQRGDGAWSYIGRGVLNIGTTQRTMNFGDLARPSCDQPRGDTRADIKFKNRRGNATGRGTPHHRRADIAAGADHGAWLQVAQPAVDLPDKVDAEKRPARVAPPLCAVQRFEWEESVWQVPPREHFGFDAAGRPGERHRPIGMRCLHRIGNGNCRKEVTTGAATRHEDGGHRALEGLPRRRPIDTSTPADTR
jgi:hypothetical protein